MYSVYGGICRKHSGFMEDEIHVFFLKSRFYDHRSEFYVDRQKFWLGKFAQCISLQFNWSLERELLFKPSNFAKGIYAVINKE